MLAFGCAVLHRHRADHHRIGDITLPGTTGRMISVVIMFAGVTLFLRLAPALFRPSKVRHARAGCGLSRHEPDAVHCKACGAPLNIPDEGRD